MNYVARLLIRSPVFGRDTCGNWKKVWEVEGGGHSVSLCVRWCACVCFECSVCVLHQGKLKWHVGGWEDKACVVRYHRIPSFPCPLWVFCFSIPPSVLVLTGWCSQREHSLYCSQSLQRWVEQRISSTSRDLHKLDDVKESGSNESNSRSHTCLWNPEKPWSPKNNSLAEWFNI